MYDSLYGLATTTTLPPPLTQRTVKTVTSIYQPRLTSATRNNRPAAFNNLTDLSFLQWLSSCTSTTQLTSATRNNCSAAFNNSTDLSYPQQSSSCILWLDRHQLHSTITQLHFTTRLTSATSSDRPAASSRLNQTSYPHHPSNWRHKYNCHGLYAHVCKYDNKLSPLLYLLPHLCFLHCLWLSITHTLKLKSFAGLTCLSAPQHSVSKTNKRH